MHCDKPQKSDFRSEPYIVHVTKGGRASQIEFASMSLVHILFAHHTLDRLWSVLAVSVGRGAVIMLFSRTYNR